MKRIAMAAASAAFAASLALGAQAAERVIIIDAPDVRQLRVDTPGRMLSEMIGTDVYGNGGKRIGEVEDFILARGGYLYAVIDVRDGPLDGILELGDGDLVVVPWDELRLSSVPE